jgi:uroporphyrinogen-III synthase
VTRVLVTRPEPGATRTAQRITALGFNAVKLPLSETVGLNPKLPPSTFDFVIATSANAFLHLPKEFQSKLGGIQTFVVGATSAAAARDAGFLDVSVGGADVEGLLFRLKGNLDRKRKVLYLCGKVRRPELELALGEWGVDPTVIEVYDTILVSQSTDKLKIFGDGELDVVLVTSMTSAAILTNMMAQPELAQIADKITFICLSGRIAQGLKLRSIARTLVCSSPDEDAMIKMLVHHFPL